VKSQCDHRCKFGQSAVLQFARNLAGFAVVTTIFSLVATAQSKPDFKHDDTAPAQATQIVDKPADTPESQNHAIDQALQRKKDQLTADTAKLLQLANELKAEMDKSSKDTLSVGVIKKAEEVEKLARKVRDEMKANLGN